MRLVTWLAIGLAGGACGVDVARADKAPTLVVPGRPGIPVIINGYDASYTVVEGDWGLARPGHMPPVIVGGPLLTPAPYSSGAYFPSQGRQPGYGRREVEPPADRRLPRSPPRYYREWGIQSQPLPATDPPPYPPPVISTAPSADILNDGAGLQGRQAAAESGMRPDRRHGRDDRNHRRRHDPRHRRPVE